MPRYFSTPRSGNIAIFIAIDFSKPSQRQRYRDESPPTLFPKTKGRTLEELSDEDEKAAPKVSTSVLTPRHVSVCPSCNSVLFLQIPPPRPTPIAGPLSDDVNEQLPQGLIAFDALMFRPRRAAQRPVPR